VESEGVLEEMLIMNHVDGSSTRAWMRYVAEGVTKIKGMCKGVVFKGVRTEEVATNGKTGLEDSRRRGGCCG